MSTIKFMADASVSGISGWHWPESDVETWGIIKYDWETHHRRNIVQVMHATNKSFNNVVQAGGNCGMYPRLLANLFRQVYTFEPDPLNFTVLSANCGVSNIFRMQAALGKVNGFVTMVHRVPVNVGMHQTICASDSVIPMIQLDTIPFETLDLLMLDIEDNEMSALLGAEQTLYRCRPVIFCENFSEEISDYLCGEMGYREAGQSRMDTILVHKDQINAPV